MLHTHTGYLNNKISPPLTLSVRPLILALALAGFGTEVMAASTYTMTDLGVAGISAQTISAKDRVLGLSTTPASVNFRTVFLPQTYTPATNAVADISSLANGLTFLDAVDINSSNQVVGHMSNSPMGVSNLSVIIRNADASFLDMGAVLGAYQTTPVAMNDSGQVAGWSSPSVYGCPNAFVSNVGGFQSLGSLDGAIGSSKASDINSSGQVVGTSSFDAATLGCNTTATKYHAFVTTATGLKDLHGNMPNFFGAGSSANAINNAGQVAGSFAVAVGAATRFAQYGTPITHAVIWDAASGAYTDLGTGTTVSSALRGINASGDAVGFSSTYAVIGNVAAGLTNLNTLTTNLSVGWTLTTARSISDAGFIVATAKDANGALHDVLLTPTVTPVGGNLPATPTNLVSTPASGTQINPTWQDNANNETAQYLERCQGTGCNVFTPLATLAANVTSYVDGSVSSATPYSYRVRAHNAAGDSAYSNIATAATLSSTQTAPAAPSALTSPVQAQRQIVLNWIDNATNENNYSVQRCKGITCNKFSTISATIAANATSYTDGSVSANTYYKYRVSASNAVGKSAYSNVISVKTLP